MEQRVKRLAKLRAKALLANTQSPICESNLVSTSNSEMLTAQSRSIEGC